MKRLKPYHWAGLGVNLAALAMVGTASTLNTMHTASITTPVAYEMLGCALIVLGQAVQAAQFVVEEKLMSDMSAPPLLIVGMEGVWGLIWMCGILVAVQYTGPLSYTYEPAECSKYADFHGQDADHQFPANCTVNLSPSVQLYHEDTPNTIYMMKNDPTIQLVIGMYIFAILGLNVAGMNVTRLMSAVTRTVFETCRTLCIWIAGLVMAYGFNFHGERWNQFSWLQAVGFVFLVIGTFIYNKIIKLPCYDYEDHPKGLLAAADYDDEEAQENGLDDLASPSTRFAAPHALPSVLLGRGPPSQRSAINAHQDWESCSR